MRHRYLTLADIAAGTGWPVTRLRHLARRHGWASQPHQTGARGRPRLLYRVADVMATLA
jgi:hypothetical protein